ncbi:MAG TPA: hypothetical protein VMZ24_04405 [Patescibacteria group bacterium]|jgi:hypothetical protein|nr:hypothetical protein [Patescibacteria group bacterium]
MKILRDEEKMAKLKKRSQQATLIGFLFLLGGFVLLFILKEDPNVYLYQIGALIAGFSLSQYGAYLMHRYGRSPRPDEVLDESVKSVARDGRMYHFLLPAPHVLLTKNGPIVFILKYQVGNISAVEDRWTQKGIGFRRYFGQEGLGNPSKDAEASITAMANYIRERAPEVEEVPIAAIIVFTTKNIANLEVAEANFPAMRADKVKGFLRQKAIGKPLPEETYNALLKAFDEAAVDLL